jgi:diacylglycerol kinase (ATP)
MEGKVSNYKFIINPMAAGGKCAKAGGVIHQLARKEGIDFDIEYTKKPHDATEIARKYCDQFEYIVAVGGDGTINEVVNGMVGGKAKLGIIPSGCGNDFIRSLSIPRVLVSAFKILLLKRTCKIDIGKANDFYFINGLGIGFDAWVVKTISEAKRLYGKSKYLYGIFKSIYQYKPVDMHISYSNTTFRDKYFMINVGNGSYMGGGFKLTPFAKLNDGLLDLNIVKNLTKLEIYKNLIKVFSGKHTNMPQVSVAKAYYVNVKSGENFAAHIDGELLSIDSDAGSYSLKISLLSEALEVIIPNDKYM